jgi:hypothetical protein
MALINMYQLLFDGGSNLNIPDISKGTLSHYAVCNNNPQYTERSVLLGRAVNCQGHRNVIHYLIADKLKLGIFKFYFNNCLFKYLIYF